MPNRSGGVCRVAALGVLGVIGVLSLAPSLQAQNNQTLLGDRPNLRWGAFGGPVFKLSQVAGDGVLFSGARGGVILNRRWSFGVGAYSMVDWTVDRSFTLQAGDITSRELSYGGFEAEFVSRPGRLLHLTVSTLVGAGETSYLLAQELSALRPATHVFVVEPALNAELNLTRWFRTSVGVGYRFVGGSTLPLASNRSLSAGTATVTFKFGRF